MCVCVRERERKNKREREKERERGRMRFLTFLIRFFYFGKHSLLGDTFKTVLTDIESEHGTSFMTERFRV